MKAISVYVPEGPYQELKAIAARAGRPVAELMRQAMIEFLERTRRSQRSVTELAPHDSGAMLADFERHELIDEMREL